MVKKIVKKKVKKTIKKKVKKKMTKAAADKEMAIIRKEVAKINKATHDYVDTVMKTMKNYPKGVTKLKKHVHRIGRHMDKLEKITKRRK